LTAGDYCSGVITKDDLRVMVTIEDPTGKELGTFISDDYGNLSFSFVVESSGRYQLKVTSRERETESREYVLTVKEIRLATDLDRKCQFAVTSKTEADRLSTEWNEKSFRSAINKYLEAAEIWPSCAQSREAAQSLRRAGDIFFMLSDYGKAIEQHQRALVLSQRIDDEDGSASALNSIAYVYANKGDQQKALANLRPLVRRYAVTLATRNTGLLRIKAEVTNSLGEVSYYLGDLKKATAYFEEALVMGNALNHRRIQALAHLNLGYVYIDSGENTNAAAHFNKAQSLSELAGDERGKAQALAAFGIVSALTGERQRSLDYYAQALNIFQQIGDRQGQAALLNSIGKIYEDSGEPNVALYDYMQALKLFQDTDNQDAQAGTNYYIGRIYQLMRQDEQALIYFEQSRALSHKMGKRRIEGYAATDMATIYGSRGQKRRALKQYLRVLEFYQQIRDRRAQAHVLNSIGYLHQMSGRGERALRFYRQALIFSRAAQDRRSEALTLYNIARAERAAGRLELAIADIKASLEISDALRTKVGSEDLRASYFASVHDRYRFYVDLLMQMDQINPNRDFKIMAFEVSDRARARSLLDLLAETELEIQRGVDPKTLERGRQLQQELSLEAEYQIRSHQNPSDPEEKSQREQRVRVLTTEFKEVQARIREQRLKSASLLPAQPLKLRDIQAELQDSDTVLLEYQLGEARSYLWAVTADSIYSYELPGRAAIEDTAVTANRLLNIRDNSGAAPSNLQMSAEDAERAYWQHATRLSEILLGKVAAQIHRKRLIIVADGALQYLPFAALPEPNVSGVTNEASSPIPLVVDHEIVTLPAASILSALRLKRADARRSADKVVVVMADPVFEVNDPRVDVLQQPASRPEQAEARASAVPGPLELARGQNRQVGLARLPFTAEEANAIIAVTPASLGRKLTGFAANKKSALSGELTHYQIVHFATHGIINDQHPELSGIVLSMINPDGSQENGFLQLQDIYELDLSADVVVLSACDTGLGKEVKGEGLIGLTRGFLYAGSRSVVASLWTVDDHATAELMRFYYEAMFKDQLSPAAALQQAQRNMWQSQRWHAPYYWAAFVFQGDYRENIKVTVKDGPWLSSRMLFLAALAVCLLAGLLLFLSKRSQANGRLNRY